MGVDSSKESQQDGSWGLLPRTPSLCVDEELVSGVHFVFIGNEPCTMEEGDDGAKRGWKA